MHGRGQCEPHRPAGVLRRSGRGGPPRPPCLVCMQRGMCRDGIIGGDARDGTIGGDARDGIIGACGRTDGRLGKCLGPWPRPWRSARQMSNQRAAACAVRAVALGGRRATGTCICIYMRAVFAFVICEHYHMWYHKELRLFYLVRKRASSSAYAYAFDLSPLPVPHTAVHVQL